MTTLENNQIKASFKTLGAELCSLIDKKSNIEHMWQADPAVWPRHAPILFPIVGALENNAYKIGSQEFFLSQHGFAREMVFEIKHQDKQSIHYRLQSSGETMKLYPYQFELTIKYTLVESELVVEYEVRNVDETAIFFSIGAHPGFTCPFQKGEAFSDYYFQFERKENAIRLLFGEGLLNGKEETFLKGEDKLNLSYNLFSEDAVILKDLKSKWVDLKSKNHGISLRFHFDGFPILAFWTKPRVNAPFLCIEPWFGIADTKGSKNDFSEKMYIQKLDVGQTFRSRYSIQF